MFSSEKIQTLFVGFQMKYKNIARNNCAKIQRKNFYCKGYFCGFELASSKFSLAQNIRILHNLQANLRENALEYIGKFIANFFQGQLIEEKKLDR